ncbi:MAG: GNAT family N-acetyltransferase [Bacteroidia bacterium]|nr:GNAT family N-acetyltransferase [Bacteroidia bacterium]
MIQPVFTPFPVLSTPRLVLREITEADAPEMLMLRSDPELMQYIHRPPATGLEDVLVYIRRIIADVQAHDGITWGITLRDSPGVIGTLGFWRLDKAHYRAEIGYMLAQAYQRQGLMQEAMSAVLRYGFEEMGLHSVEANVSPDNEPSQGILLRNGFVREGYFRENYFFNGQFLDSAIYSLVKGLTYL